MSSVTEKDLKKAETSQDGDTLSRVETYSARRGVYTFAYAAICWERFWPLAIPAYIIAIIFLCLSWFGLWQQIPDIARWAILAVIAGLFLFALSRLSAFRFPTKSETYRRIEKSSDIDHRPVTAQIDEPANLDSPFARVL